MHLSLHLQATVCRQADVPGHGKATHPGTRFAEGRCWTWSKTGAGLSSAAQLGRLMAVKYTLLGLGCNVKGGGQLPASAMRGA